MAKTLKELRLEKEHWQMIARQETRWLGQTIKKANQAEKEYQEALKNKGKRKVADNQ